MDQREVADRMEIQQVIYRYCRGVDRGEATLISSVYHADATDDHGTYKGSGVDFADYLVPSMDRQKLPSQHHVTNLYIEFHESYPEVRHAHVESYFIAFHPIGEGADEVLAQMGGRYLDVFEERAGEWKISSRRVICDWTRSALPGEAWQISEHFPTGGRREADVSHSLFRRGV